MSGSRNDGDSRNEGNSRIEGVSRIEGDSLNERRAGIARLRPAGPMAVSRAREVRTARGTVMFADLRGYTGMAERLPAARVVPLLDEFFFVLTSATAQFGGEVFHMAGDGFMAGFGVHDASLDGAAEAFAAGHAILSNFAPIAARWRSELTIESGIGVGLHLGEVAVGAFGPRRRKSTTLIGDTVNVAARLCGRARAGEVLFSCTVAAALGERAPYLRLPQFERRGRSEPIDIWCVPAQQRLAL
jgi:adenylate cyclase